MSNKIKNVYNCKPREAIYCYVCIINIIYNHFTIDVYNQ